MTTPVFVKKARQDIWTHGKPVAKTHEKGKHAGKEYETTDRSQPRDEHDTILVPKGESYWYWSFRFGPKHISKERPKRSQLTQSEWKQKVYLLEEQMEETTANDASDLESLKQDWIDTIQEMIDEAQERLDAMPESLQENSSSGQTLTEYIEAFESWCDDLESVDIDIDEESLRDEAEIDVPEDDGRVLDGEDRETLIVQRIDELRQEKIEEILSEMQQHTSGI